MCIIVYLRLKGNTLLIKNRDRNYVPKIQIIHEKVNGVEVAYMRDLDTEWVEGLNEHGFGIVNSSLEVNFDENPICSNTVEKKYNIKSREKYINTLATKSVNQFQNRIFDPSYYEDIQLQGHNIIATPYYGLHVESFTGYKPKILLLKENIVRTNHGINIKNSGYTHGKPYQSSVYRKRLIEKEIENNNLSSYDDVFNIMNKNYPDIEIDYHTYRDNPKYFCTTSQMILDLTNRIMIFNYDKDYCKFMGVVNRMGKIKPRITIVTNQTSKKK